MATNAQQDVESGAREVGAGAGGPATVGSTNADRGCGCARALVQWPRLKSKATVSAAAWAWRPAQWATWMHARPKECHALARAPHAQAIGRLCRAKPHVIIVPVVLCGLMMGLGIWAVIQGAANQVANDR